MKKDLVVGATVATAATVVAAGVLFVRWRKRDERRWRQTQRILQQFANDCLTPVPKLWHIAFDLVCDMQASISDEPQSDFVMLPSYTPSLPDGTEEGLYYGVNIREDSFLLLCARFRGKTEPIADLQRQEVEIPSIIKGGTYEELFDFIAFELADFIKTTTKTDPSAPKGKLGLTVSFPMFDGPTAATKEEVIRWKKYSMNDSPGKELARIANRALEIRGLDLPVHIGVDATVGDLAGGRYYNKEAVAAVTLGLYTNAVYIESAQLIPKRGEPKDGEMVMDMQWGNFNTPHLPITDFDIALDDESSNPGYRMFEKLVGGIYQCEIVRRVLLKMARQTAIFGETVPAKLKTPYSLRPADMAAMHQDTSENRDTVQEKLMEVYGITYTTPEVRGVVAEVCDVVAERAARLAGACIVGIMKKRGRINDRKSVVSVEGELYENYRVFRNYLHSSVWEMLGSALSDNVIIEQAHGGSGAGSLFVAAATSQIPFSVCSTPSLPERKDYRKDSIVGGGRDDQKYSPTGNINEPTEWKDDQTVSASLKGDQVDSTVETSDQSESSDE